MLGCFWGFVLLLFLSWIRRLVWCLLFVCVCLLMFVMCVWCFVFLCFVCRFVCFVGLCLVLVWSVVLSCCCVFVFAISVAKALDKLPVLSQEVCPLGADPPRGNGWALVPRRKPPPFPPPSSLRSRSSDGDHPCLPFVVFMLLLLFLKLMWNGFCIFVVFVCVFFIFGCVCF